MPVRGPPPPPPPGRPAKPPPPPGRPPPPPGRPAPPPPPGRPPPPPGRPPPPPPPPGPEGRPCGIIIGFGRGPPGRGPPAPGPGRGPAAPGGPGRGPGAGRSPPGRGGRGIPPSRGGPSRRSRGPPWPPSRPPGRSPPGRRSGRAWPMPLALDENGLLPGRGPRGPGLGPGRGPPPDCAPGREPCWRSPEGRSPEGRSPEGRSPEGPPGRGAGPGLGPPGRGAGPGRGPGVGRAEVPLSKRACGASGRGASGCAGACCCWCGIGTGPGRGPGFGAGPGLGPGRGADGIGASAPLPAWLSAGRGAALGGCGLLDDEPPPLLDPPFDAPRASVSLRTTGASMVEDAERTNSPISWSLAMTTLLSTPNSLASSYTRTFATALPYSAREAGCAVRTVVNLTSSSPRAHQALIAI